MTLSPIELAIFGCLLALSGGIALDHLRIYRQDKQRLNEVPAKLRSLAVQLKAAILGDMIVLDSNEHRWLFDNHHIFCKKEKLNQAFTTLNNMCIFLKTGGYKNNQERVATDVPVIDDFLNG